MTDISQQIAPTTTPILILALTIAICASASAQNGLDIVRPYSVGEPALSADRVYLSQDEFLKLYEAAHPGELRAATAPGSASVAAAIYNSEELQQVNGKSWTQRFRARFVIRSFSDGAVNVSLPLGSVAIRSATLDGENAILVPAKPRPWEGEAPAEPRVPQDALRGSGSAGASPSQNAALQQQANALAMIAPPENSPAYAVRVSKQGLHVLDIVFDVPTTVEESVGRLEIPLLPVPAGTLTLQLPGSGDDSREGEDPAEPREPMDADPGSGSAGASPSQNATRLAVTVNGRTNTFRRDRNAIVVPVSSGGILRIQWQPETSRTSADAVFHSVVHSALVIDDSGLVVRATLSTTVRQGQISELNVALPADYSVRQVTGSELAGWSIEQQDGSPSLKLLFKQPIDGSVDVDVQLFSRQVFSTDRTTVSVPVLAVAGASRDSGNVSVLAGGELQIRTEAISGVSQINPIEAIIPNGIDGSPRPVLAWRYTRHPVSISIRVAREVDKLEVTALHGVQLEAQRQLWTSHFRAIISGAPRRRLDIEVPSSFLALDVNANDLADWYITEPDDEDAATKTLSVQFSVARTGPVDVVIQGQTNRAADRFQPTISVPRIPAATMAETKLSVWLDAASEIAGFTAAGWNTVAPGQVDERILALQADAPEISFVTQSVSPAMVSLNLREAKASLLAESVSVTNVTDTSLELTLALNWQISRAATSSLSFELPASLADVFDFTVPELRQLQKTPVDDDRVRLTIHLQQPVSESFFVLGVGTLPLPDDRQVAAAPPTFVTNGDSDTSTTIANQSHFWVVVNQSSGVMEAVAPDTDGDDVAADQIRTEIPEGFLQQSVAIRRLSSGRPQSAWRLSFPEQQQVAPAVIALAEHVTILSEDASWRSRHRLQVRNESRQFLPVFVPDDSRFLYCLVKGQPTRVVSRIEGDRTLYLIPVPQSGAVAAPFDVEFALAGLVDQSAMNLDEAWRQRAFDVPVPTFPEYRDFPDYGVTVSRNTWSVYVPESWQATIDDDPRRTNVVPADEGDFIDAEVYLSTENVNALLAVVGRPSSASESVRREAELLRQREQLARQRGADAMVEAERAKSLQQINEYFVQQQQSGQTRQAEQLQLEADSGGVFSDGSTAFDVITGNSFLYEQDAKQNLFNDLNNGRFLMENSARRSGEQKNDGIDVGEEQRFNFDLPEEWKLELATTLQPPTDKEAKPARGRESVKESLGMDSSGAVRNRSQLIEQNQTQMGRKSGVGEGRVNEKFMADPFPPEPTREEAIDSPGDVAVQSLDDLGLVIIGGDQVEADRVADIIEAQDALQRSGTGLLSLEFAIPTDGRRHDFVRTGGNPELTLEVRGSEAVDKGLGALWAAACVVALLFVLRSVKAGDSRTLIRRLLLLAAIIGLCGWLFLPPPANSWSVTLCIAAAIGFCICLVIESFRNIHRAGRAT